MERLGLADCRLYRLFTFAAWSGSNLNSECHAGYRLETIFGCTKRNTVDGYSGEMSKALAKKFSNLSMFSCGKEALKLAERGKNRKRRQSCVLSAYACSCLFTVG